MLRLVAVGYISGDEGKLRILRATSLRPFGRRNRISISRPSGASGEPWSGLNTADIIQLVVNPVQEQQGKSETKAVSVKLLLNGALFGGFFFGGSKALLSTKTPFAFFKSVSFFFDDKRIQLTLLNLLSSEFIVKDKTKSILLQAIKSVFFFILRV